jgi:hypothetical protein
MAGLKTRSRSSRATTVQLVVSKEMPAISSGETPLSSIAPCTAATRHDHHSFVSCSAQPGRACCVAYSSLEKTTGVPSRSKMPTRTLSVPPSMPTR